MPTALSPAEYLIEIDSRGYSYRDYLSGTWLSEGNFLVTIGECERTPLSPITEAVQAAKLIGEQFQGPLYLCLSGGVDSECMALAFIEAKVPFRVAIQRFNNQLNGYDIVHAIEFCQRRSISYEIFDLDITDFYARGEHFRYAELYGCNTPQISVLLDLMKRINGVPIMAWSLIEFEKAGDQFLPLVPYDAQFTYYQFLNREGRKAIPFFFLYTPELIFSFFQLPRLTEFFHQARSGRQVTFDYELKCDLYRDGGFRIRNKPKKYSGFEGVISHYAQLSGGDLDAYDRQFRLPLYERFARGLRKNHFIKMSRKHWSFTER